MNYLIDTNTILEFISRSLPPTAHSFLTSVINSNFNVSVINRIEVLGHESAEQYLIDFMDLATTHPLTELVVNETIALRKVKKLKLPDAIIAATALVYGFTLISRNTRDFQNIAGLECLNPYQLA